MKNVLLLILAAVCVYQYMNPKVVTHEVQVPVTVVKAVGPRLYYHSPLDAPAMPTGANTGTGYFSTDPNSRFTTTGGATSHAPGGSGYVPRSAAPVTDTTNPLASVDALQAKLNEPQP